MTGAVSTRFRFLDSIERRIYRFIGTDPSDEQDWKGYAVAMLIFNAIGLAVLLFIGMLKELEKEPALSRKEDSSH